MIEDGGRFTNDFLSRLFTFPHFSTPANKCSATEGSLSAAYHTFRCDRPVSCCIEGGVGCDMSSITASIPLPRAAADRSALNPWIISVPVTLPTFMEPLDSAIAHVASPPH